MARIICLANSRKQGNRCIAGIDPVTGRWVRPVSDLADGGIALWTQIDAGVEPQILDVLEIPLQDAGNDYGFQPENRLLAPGKWKVVARANPRDLLPYCEQGPIILHNRYDRAPWKFLQALSPEKRKSLCLVRAGCAHFYEKTVGGGKSQVRVDFSLGTHAPYDLVVTDPVAEHRARGCREFRSECILAVSLGWPYPEDDPNPQCYKLVAGVIEL